MRTRIVRSIAVVMGLFLVSGCSAAATACSDYLSADAARQESLTRRALSDHDWRPVVPIEVIAADVRAGCQVDPAVDLGTILTGIGAPDESSSFDGDSPLFWLVVLAAGGAVTLWRRQRDAAAADALATSARRPGGATTTDPEDRTGLGRPVELDDLPHLVLLELRECGALEVGGLAARLGRPPAEVADAVEQLESAEQVWVDPVGKVRSSIEEAE